jgi:hypothetical protein
LSRAERRDSRDWVQPRNSASRGLAIRQKGKLVSNETFRVKISHFLEV